MIYYIFSVSWYTISFDDIQLFKLKIKISSNIIHTILEFYLLSLHIPKQIKDHQESFSVKIGLGISIFALILFFYKLINLLIKGRLSMSIRYTQLQPTRKRYNKEQIVGYTNKEKDNWMPKYEEEKQSKRTYKHFIPLLHGTNKCQEPHPNQS